MSAALGFSRALRSPSGEHLRFWNQIEKDQAEHLGREASSWSDNKNRLARVFVGNMGNDKVQNLHLLTGKSGLHKPSSSSFLMAVLQYYFGVKVPPSSLFIPGMTISEKTLLIDHIRRVMDGSLTQIDLKSADQKDELRARELKTIEKLYVAWIYRFTEHLIAEDRALSSQDFFSWPIAGQSLVMVLLSNFLGSSESFDTDKMIPESVMPNLKQIINRSLLKLIDQSFGKVSSTNWQKITVLKAKIVRAHDNGIKPPYLSCIEVFLKDTPKATRSFWGSQEHTDYFNYFLEQLAFIDKVTKKILEGVSVKVAVPTVGDLPYYFNSAPSLGSVELPPSAPSRSQTSSLAKNSR